jgi:hypothetical protein
MTATSSMQWLWLVAMCLLVAAVPCRAGEVPDAEVELTWKSSGYDRSNFTQQDRLEGIRCAFSPLKTARGTSLEPLTVCGMDLEMPSLRVLPKHSGYDFGGWYIMMTNAQAIRLFRFDPSQHTGWITLADVWPPLVTTEYHKVVIRLLQTYGDWKSEADARLLGALRGPGDPGFLSVIEWELNRPGR